MRFFQLVLLYLAVVACVPQMSVLQVEVKDVPGKHIVVENKQIAVFAVSSANRKDSLYVENAAMALAQKFEQDRGSSDPLPVFSLSELDFGNSDTLSFDRNFLRSLMFSNGADLQIFVHSLKWGNFNSQRVADYEGGYGQRVVYIPYSAAIDVYDTMADSLLFKRVLGDTIYMNILSERPSGDFTSVVGKKLPELSAVVGEAMGALLSEQWLSQERMLVNFQENPKWRKGFELACDFKWKDAVQIWSPFVESDNFRISAYAAYNIAVACEMMGYYPLALQWGEFSLKRYPFYESRRYVEYLRRK